MDVAFFQASFFSNRTVYTLFYTPFDAIFDYLRKGAGEYGGLTCFGRKADKIITIRIVCFVFFNDRYETLIGIIKIDRARFVN